MSNRKPHHRKDFKSPLHYTPLEQNDAAAYSDSETILENGKRRNTLDYYQLAGSSMPDLKNQHLFSKMAQSQNADDNLTDDDRDLADSYLQFGQNYGNKNVRTGRQRKKFAARSKGGEFQTKRRKRRVYFCCISSEIDIQKLLDYLQGANDLLYDWKFELHNDVLHLFKSGSDEIALTRGHGGKETHTHNDDIGLAVTPPMHSDKTLPIEVSFPFAGQNKLHPKEDNYDGDETIPTVKPPDAVISFDEYLQQKLIKVGNPLDFGRQDSQQNPLEEVSLVNHKLLSFASKEVFIFDFGAAVFWGFSRGEEVGLLKTIRMFVTKGMVGVNEFEYGEDDMAFVISPEEKVITIANDVISLPEETLPKQRLAVSFAIAQSSVLSIFEARIEQKVDEYKYIPEALAAYGKVHLSERQLGMMIGEVFVIRHDVNLHTEILDTPDFFWKEKIFESDYKMVSSYLEMSSRTEILNKRLDMLRELLDVLQQQMENAHAVKLEWIVIYLIVAEVVLQGLAIISKCNYIADVDRKTKQEMFRRFVGGKTTAFLASVLLIEGKMVLMEGAEKRNQTNPSAPSDFKVVQPSFSATNVYRKPKGASGNNETVTIDSLKLISGSANPKLSQEISRAIMVPLCTSNINRFADGEVSVQINENIRGKDVFIIQSCVSPVNDSIMELLLTVSCARRASARRIVAIIPYFAYKHHRRSSNMSFKHNSRFLTSEAADFAAMLQELGVDRVISVDLQRPGQGLEACFFDNVIPLETVITTDTFINYLLQQNLKEPVTVIAPNAEVYKKGKTFQRELQKKLNSEVRLIPYFSVSDDSGFSDVEQLEGQSINFQLDGGDVIIVDDIVDTATTIQSLGTRLHEAGANEIFVCASHGLFSEHAMEVMDASKLSKIIVTDSLPLPPNPSSKIVQLSLAPLLSDIILTEHFRTVIVEEDEFQEE